MTSREQPSEHLIVLLGPPAGGVSSVGTALAALSGRRYVDLGELLVQQLNAPAELTLVSVGEQRYREEESRLVRELLASAQPGDILGLGSGFLDDALVVDAVRAAQESGALVVAVSAELRTLATRNGLDVPRSVALGPVNHSFTLFLREREAQLRELADLWVDTDGRDPQECAQQILG